MFKIIKCASYYVMSLIASNMVLYEYGYTHVINNHIYYFKNKFIYMYITMNNLTDNLVNHIYDYSIGDKTYWKSKFKDVIDEIAYFHVDDIVSEYVSHEIVRYKDLDINIINCWFHLDYKFKQYMINDILHIVRYNNHPFYNDIEYYLLSFPHLVRTTIKKDEFYVKIYIVCL